MGPGKTVQVLAHILTRKQRRRLKQPALVVAPSSLVGNWRDEAARFAPTLKVLVLHRANRAEHYDAIPAHDLVITTYPLLPRDEDRLREAHFSLLVLRGTGDQEPAQPGRPGSARDSRRAPAGDDRHAAGKPPG